MPGNEAIAAGMMLFRIAPSSALAPDILERVAFSRRKNSLLGQMAMGVRHFSSGALAANLHFKH